MINFAYSAFLAGTIAITVPILLHFLKKKPVTKTMFPSFMFLHATIAAAATKNKIRKWLVLILRTMTILMLSLAFAKPFFSTITPKIKTATVILWDNSMSMSALSYKDEIKQKALTQIATASTQNKIKIGLIGSASLWSQNFEVNKKNIEDFFLSNAKTNSTSSFPNALKQANSFLSKLNANSKKIIIISDQQKSPWKKLSLTDKLTPGISIKSISPQKVGFDNIAVYSPSSKIIYFKSDNKISFPFSIVNFSNSKSFNANISLFINNQKIYSIEKLIKPKTTFNDKIYIDPSEKTPVHGKITVIADDDISLDNTFFFSLKKNPIPYTAIYPYIPGKFDFIEKALSSSKKTQASKIIPLTTANCNKADFFIIQAPLPINSNIQTKFLNNIKNGKSALLIWNNSPAFRSLLYNFNIRILKNENLNQTSFANINFEHPIFSAFKNVKISSFFEVYFKSHAKSQLPENSSKIADFADGSPAIAEIPYGKGKIFFLTAPINRKNSNWPILSSFLPFLREILKSSIINKPDNEQYSPGKIIAFKNKTSVWTPDKKYMIAKNSTSFIPQSTGNFLLINKFSQNFLSVNYPITESKSKILDKNFSLTKLLTSKKNLNSLSNSQVQKQSNKNNSKLWLFLIAFAALFILAELLIANRTAL